MKKLLLTLIFSSALYAQPAITLEDLTIYDENNDGITVFNLTGNTIALLDGLDPEEHTISYHFTFKDADVNRNAIPDAIRFTNTTPNEQELYARVTSIADPEEYSVDLFTIRTYNSSGLTQESASKAIKASTE